MKPGAGTFRLRAWSLGRAGFWVALLCAGCAAQVAVAQIAPPALEQVRRSVSGQFVVNVTPFKRQETRLISNLETNKEYIRLEPTIVPVSCERIKQVLSRELGLNAPWTGRIFVSLYPTTSADDPVNIVIGQFRDGWQYRLEVPELVNRFRYVRGVIQALLLEAANRRATTHSAEIPVWLSEGLAEELMLSSETEIILPPPRAGGGNFSLATRTVNARKENPLEVIHQQLCAHPPLSFQQLSWPEPDQLEGEAAATYRDSAYLFVYELLRLEAGRACLHSMLAQLPQHYNWQFAFLKAFQPYFQRPVDVEKWWSLHIEQFTGRELAQTWPLDKSWQKLDELVRSAVQIRSGTNELPMQAEVKLQTIVRECDRSQQDQALRQKTRELQMLRVRLAPELVPLADDYQRVLVNYLQNRDHGGLPLLKKAARRHTVQETLRELDALDARRLEAKAVSAPAAIQANSAATRP